MSIGVMLFNPFTGKPRHPDDITSDPRGILVWDGEEPLKVSPPQRTWVGLTDVEWMNIVNKDHAWFGQRPEDVAHEVAKLVEAKLKEKNT